MRLPFHQGVATEQEEDQQLWKTQHCRNEHDNIAQPSAKLQKNRNRFIHENWPAVPGDLLTHYLLPANRYFLMGLERPQSRQLQEDI